MPPNGSAFRPAAALALILLGTLAAGCEGGLEQAMVPPKADVTGIQRVAVMPFANASERPDLADELHEEVLAVLRESGWYEVVSPDEVASLLASERLDARDVSGKLARDLGLALEADGVIVGTALEYAEDVAVDSPFLVSNDAAGEPPAWQADQHTTVTVSFSAELINVHTGAVVHGRQVQVEAVITDSRPLNWLGTEPPPGTVVPSPHRRDIAQARQEAVRKAARLFTADILPSYEWVRQSSDDEP